jgi:hypothetical protein
MSRLSVYLGTFEREGQMQKYYSFLNLGPAAGPAQANTTVLQLPIIETRAEVWLGVARADDSQYRPNRAF